MTVTIGMTEQLWMGDSVDAEHDPGHRDTDCWASQSGIRVK